MTDAKDDEDITIALRRNPRKMSIGEMRRLMLEAAAEIEDLRKECDTLTRSRGFQR